MGSQKWKGLIGKIVHYQVTLRKIKYDFIFRLVYVLKHNVGCPSSKLPRASKSYKVFRIKIYKVINLVDFINERHMTLYGHVQGLMVNV